MSHSVLARVYNPKVDPSDKNSEPPYTWVDYGAVTHCEAARLHSEKYPFKRQIIETCWGDKSSPTTYLHNVITEVIRTVTPLRKDS